MSIEQMIKRESAGNIYTCTKGQILPKEFGRLLIKIQGPSRLNCVGIREPGIWALLSMPNSKCTIKQHVRSFIEITRIECDMNVRGTGRCMEFIKRIAITCKIMNRCLVMGCVESKRMLQLMNRHNDVWHRLESDPTSYVYYPTIFL